MGIFSKTHLPVLADSQELFHTVLRVTEYSDE